MQPSTLKKTTISLLIVNYNELNHKDKKKQEKNRLRLPSSCVPLLSSPSLQQNHQKRCRSPFFLQKSHRKIWWKLSSSSSLWQWKQQRRWRLLRFKKKRRQQQSYCHLLCYSNTKTEGHGSVATVAFYVVTKRRKIRQR